MPPFRTTDAEYNDGDDRSDHLSPASSAPKTEVTKTSRLPFWSAVVLTGVITTASFVLSFAALWDLFTQVGQPRKLSWLFAILLDGAILQATISVVWLADAPGEKGRSDRRFFWIVLIFSATASIFGNALHAYTNHAPEFDPRLAAAIATIAPVALLFSSHGLTILARRSRPAHVATVRAETVNSAYSAVPATAEMNEEDAAEQTPSDHPQPRLDSAETTPGPPTKKFATPDERKEHALALNASGVPMPDIAAAVDRSPSTIYRWIDEAKVNRPLVPQGRQLTNVR